MLLSSCSLVCLVAMMGSLLRVVDVGMLGVSFVLVPWFLVELGFVGSDMMGV